MPAMKIVLNNGGWDQALVSMADILLSSCSS